MKNSDTAGTIIGTRRQTIAETVTVAKMLRTNFGDVNVSVSPDRKGEFEPRILNKNQTSIRQNIEDRILYKYAKGMTMSDMKLYSLGVSHTTISRITDKAAHRQKMAAAPA